MMLLRARPRPGLSGAGDSSHHVRGTRRAWGGHRPRTWRFLAILLLAVSACRGNEPMPVEIGPEDRDPSWSPDGQWIAFGHSDSSDLGSVYVIRTDGTGRRRVLAGAFDPDWSPDGGSLVVNLGGSILARVNLGSGEVLPLTGVQGHTPAWSPDGGTIAFSSDGGDGTYPPVLWTVPAAGGTAARVPLPGPRTELSQIDWSPTSTQLVATEFAARERLFITTLAGSDTSRIAVPDLNVSQPAWSPRGDRIAYVRARVSEVGDIWLVRPDGSNHRLLVSSAASPCWSPDGTRVAFAHRQGNTLSIWAVDTLGQNLQRITPSY